MYFAVLTLPHFYLTVFFFYLKKSSSRVRYCKLASALNTMILALDSRSQIAVLQLYTVSVPIE